MCCTETPDKDLISNWKFKCIVYNIYPNFESEDYMLLHVTGVITQICASHVLVIV